MPHRVMANLGVVQRDAGLGGRYRCLFQRSTFRWCQAGGDQPEKTWAGFFGGIAGSLLFALLASFVLDMDQQRWRRCC